MAVEFDVQIQVHGVDSQARHFLPVLPPTGCGMPGALVGYRQVVAQCVQCWRIGLEASGASAQEYLHAWGCSSVLGGGFLEGWESFPEDQSSILGTRE
jgi:hypothetical protein